MIRILRIINRFNIGGPTYNVTFLSRFLDDDFETLLIGGLPEKGEADSLYIPESYGIQPRLIAQMKRSPNLVTDWKAYREIKQIIKEYKPHIVHTHASKAGAIGRQAAYACHVPVVVHTFHGHVFHSYFGRVKTNVYLGIERYLAHKSTGIIAISDLQKHELGTVFKICKPEKIKVIPLGFDLQKFHVEIEDKRKHTRDNYNLQETEVAIAIVGRLTAIKNHQYFLDIIETIAPTNPSIKVFIVGDGDLREAIDIRVKQINNKIRRDMIVMTSWIKDIASFNAGMDIICLTSDNEGTPVSLIEAQASGIPVISTNVGGVKDILQEGITGYIAANKDEFIEKLTLLVENKDIRGKMSQNGWNYVQDRFSYQNLVKRTEEYYIQLLKSKGIECR